MKLFRKIELTNYTLGSAKVEKWSFYYLSGCSVCLRNVRASNDDRQNR